MAVRMKAAASCTQTTHMRRVVDAVRYAIGACCALIRGALSALSCCLCAHGRMHGTGRAHAWAAVPAPRNARGDNTIVQQSQAQQLR